MKDRTALEITVLIAIIVVVYFLPEELGALLGGVLLG